MAGPEPVSTIAGRAALLGMTQAQLEGFMASLGEPRYRARQVFQWLFRHRAADFQAMTNLPAALRTLLEERAVIDVAQLILSQEDPDDGTRKFLFRLLADGETVETVLMRYRHGFSLCVSTQVGCRMGCRFCASTMGGKVRDLTAAEIVQQVVSVQRALDPAGERIGSIVVMGMGEPLENYDNLVRFLRIVNDPEGLGIGLRHITVSTVGLVPAIRRLAEEGLPVTLAVSLHAPNDYIRSQIMPINVRYPLAQLMHACRDYVAKTGRRISFEYIMMDGVNDHPELARELAVLVGDLLCHINLIPYNPVPDRPYKPSPPRRMQVFRDILRRAGLQVTIRRTLGRKIEAACGQLRRRALAEKQEGRPVPAKG